MPGIYICPSDVNHLQGFRVAGARDWWNLTSVVAETIQPEDTIIFYMKGPKSAFVASGTVDSEVIPCPDNASKYRDQLCVWVRDIQMLPDEVEISAAKQFLPEWPYLRRPDRTIKVPPGIVANFLQLINVPLRATDPELEQNLSTCGAGFASPEKNKEVEQKAITWVTKHYETLGWNVKSRERDRCGFDLECRRGELVEHVEVKGISGSDQKFIITDGELRRAKEDSNFVLIAVTLALSHLPQQFRYSDPEFIRSFDLSAIAYWARLKKSE